MKKNGFTLAEVLITLGIVGVVAAMTIPTLVANYQKQVYGTSLAAAVSDIENAFSLMAQEKGNGLLQDTPFMKASSTAEAAEYLEEYLQLENSVDKPSLIYDSTNPKSVSGKSSFQNLFSDRTFITKKGFVIITYPNTDDRMWLSEAEAAENGTTLAKGVLEIMLDINGTKKPNTMGRDFFGFLIDENGKLYPWGGKDYAKYMNVAEWTSTTDTTNGCVDLNTAEGWGCTARLIENKYKMDY